MPKPTAPAPSPGRTTEYSFVLRSSKIEGIGVFAVHAIRKGTKLRLFPASDRVRRIRSLPRGKEQFLRYCVEHEGTIYAPADFGRMSIGWYLNHSKRPNAHHRNYVYFASRDIRAGEEITIDYRTLESESGP